MKKGYERYVRRSIHPTAGSKYTVVLGPPVEPPIWVKKRRHFDRPLKKDTPSC